MNGFSQRSCQSSRDGQSSPGLAEPGEERPKGLVLLEPLSTRGDLHCQGHGMGKVLFQELPGLWQGVPALQCSCPAAGASSAQLEGKNN